MPDRVSLSTCVPAGQVARRNNGRSTYATLVVTLQRRAEDILREFFCRHSLDGAGTATRSCSELDIATDVRGGNISSRYEYSYDYATQHYGTSTRTSS